MFERRLGFVPRQVDDPVISSDKGTQDFAGLFAAHYAVLTRIVYRVVGDAAWAEEVAAEAFCKLHRKPPRDCQNLPGWLYRTALRLALDNLKKRKRRAHYEALAPPPKAVRSPEEAVERWEKQQRVRQVLGALKPDQAAILVLRSEGYSLAEIAALQGLNPGSVGTFLARADQAFRKEYVKRYGQL
jgi:RNA polymerase sigma-70 factor (ECF subfamily)